MCVRTFFLAHVRKYCVSRGHWADNDTGRATLITLVILNQGPSLPVRFASYHVGVCVFITYAYAHARAAPAHTALPAAPHLLCMVTLKNSPIHSAVCF